MSDYPDDDELRTLREWSGTPAELIDYLRDGHWWMPDWGLRVTRGTDDAPEPAGIIEPADHTWLHLSTGGWSGNEDRLAALDHSGRLFGFWHRFWFSSRVGGHYQFRIPDRSLNDPINSFEYPGVTAK